MLHAWMMLATTLAAAPAEPFDHVLFDFRGPKPAQGWWLNIWGKNAAGEKGTGAIEVVPGRRGGHALRLRTENAGANNFVSPVAADGPWRQRRYSAVAVWFRGDGRKVKKRFVVQTRKADGKGLNSYSASLFLGDKGWRRVVLRSFWRRRGTPELDLSRLHRILIAGAGTQEVTLGEIRLLCGGPRLPLERAAQPFVAAPRLASAPAIDGKLDDAAWKTAALITDFKVFRGEPKPAKYPTEVRVGYRGDTLYLAARLRGENPKRLPARWRRRDAPVWKDSCLEFYLDPGDTNAAGYQFAVNAAGARFDLGKTLAWSGDWKAAARRDEKDGWSVEIACRLGGFPAAAKPGAVWGFNLKRHVVSPDGKFLEVSGWSQGTPGPASGFGALAFGPLSDAKLRVWEPEMQTVRDDLRLCRVLLDNDAGRPVRVEAEVAVFPPGGERVLARAAAALSAGGAATLELPLAFPVRRDGRHLLTLALRDTQGRLIDWRAYAFLLSKPMRFRYDDIVLWPPPQVWRLQKGYWRLPDRPTWRVVGRGDAFPGEHLADMLKRRYGVAPRASAAGRADITLEYAANAAKPEGFVLDVNARGARLRASSGRGMYYAVRALLDLIRQSTLGEADARARCVHCEDWPAVPIRVLYHRIDDYYRAPKGVQTYKDFIYDQVAGGRYNLLILNCRGGVRYDSHPEIAHSRPFSKAELREVLDFARRHYVDVAPGGNAPGHAGWLTIRHPDLREDGDRNTLCTRNPKSLPLLFDLYDELADLFAPTRYFHLGGDEVRWKTDSVPPAKRCARCKGALKRDLLLAFWLQEIDWCRRRGLRPILWEDMLAPAWNGGAPHYTARILPRLPKGTILASWTSRRELVNPPALYRRLGLVPWKINTSFGPSNMETFLAWWKEYDAVGIAEFMAWPWCNFLHASYEKLCAYSTPAVHCCAACAWKPATAAAGWRRLVAAQGRHWMKVMRVTEWGARRLRYAPLSIEAACNESTRDEKAGDGRGWLDLGPDRDLRALPAGRVVVGETPFLRPRGPRDCVLLRGDAASAPVKVGRKVRGLVFLHTAAASKSDIAKLYKRFFRKNTEPYGMTIASYRVRYADGRELAAPVKLGWSAHFWDCYPPARVMPGARAYWTGCTEARRRRDPHAPDACAWTMEWKNPRPDAPIESVRFAAAGTEATVIWLGLAAVE